MAVEIHLVTPEREVWAGQARELVARGTDGEVGILTGHAPLLVRLAIGPLRIYRDDEPDLAVVIDGGFMHVSSGEDGTRIDVMAAHAVLADQIDVEAAREDVTRLENLLRERDTGQAEADIESAKVELAKAQARINLAG
jgi:F-type H+-transporting ATPase subunit epsilon